MMIVFAILGFALIAEIVAMVRRPRVLTLLTIFLLIVLIGVLLGPMTGRIWVAQEAGTMQTCRTIALAEFQYANDHDGRYPDGKSSTEVFQKLLDGSYVTDPVMFYIPMAGKSSTRSHHLEPANVCYDVTGGIEGTIPNGLPVVFMTGYQIDYRAGGRFVRQHGALPDFFKGEPRTWTDWMNFQPRMPIPVAIWGGNSDNLAMKSNLPSDRGATADRESLESAGKIYRQLTPDGVLK